MTYDDEVFSLGFTELTANVNCEPAKPLKMTTLAAVHSICNMSFLTVHSTHESFCVLNCKSFSCRRDSDYAKQGNFRLTSLHKPVYVGWLLLLSIQVRAVGLTVKSIRTVDDAEPHGHL